MLPLTSQAGYIHSYMMLQTLALNLGCCRESVVHYVFCGVDVYEYGGLVLQNQHDRSLLVVSDVLMNLRPSYVYNAPVDDDKATQPSQVFYVGLSSFVCNVMQLFCGCFHG